MSDVKYELTDEEIQKVLGGLLKAGEIPTEEQKKNVALELTSLILAKQQPANSRLELDDTQLEGINGGLDTDGSVNLEQIWKYVAEILNESWDKKSKKCGLKSVDLSKADNLTSLPDCF